METEAKINYFFRQNGVKYKWVGGEGFTFLSSDLRPRKALRWVFYWWGNGGQERRSLSQVIQQVGGIRRKKEGLGVPSQALSLEPWAA